MFSKISTQLIWIVGFCLIFPYDAVGDIMCYNCTSYSNTSDTCGDPYKGTDSEMVTCGSTGDSCIKFITSFDNITVTHRGCINSTTTCEKYVSSVNITQNSIIINVATNYCLICDSDHCNSSPAIGIASFTFVVALLFSKIF